VTNSDVAAQDSRVLVLAPTSKDAALAESLLSSTGIPVQLCENFDALMLHLAAGAAAILISEEAVSSARNPVLCDLLTKQPPWSDLPVLVLTRPGADSADLGEAVRTLGNVTLLERPVRVATLLSAVKTALRARERQYQIRGHLAERTRAEQALRIADQRKDDFLATLGHELRNPLAPLVTALQLLKQTGPRDAATDRVSAVMERQVNHLVRLVDDLLELSRITRGLIEVRREPLDLVLVVRAAIDMSQPAIDASGHDLTVDVPHEPITIAGDGIRLTQVFANLLTNAAKYTNRGGHIWLTVKRERAFAVVSVRDNGIGIAPEQLESVFEMFTQIDRSNRRTQGGLGVGLTLVRSLVTLHSGRVEARSDGAGKGSEFVVHLPILTEGRVRTDQRESEAPFPGRRVLVVDDNRDAAETLGALLAELGATVEVACSGGKAFETLESFNPDTVLLDLGMPDMDGYEVSRRIRQAPEYRGLLVIALTGWGQEEDRRRSREAGFDHHLVKPPDIDALRQLFLSDRAAGG
jgi:signal transduction histidine kinase/ActR/RegA family two-component response regulator